jgi:hypothetical protein
MNERPDPKRCTAPGCPLDAHPAYGDVCESCHCEIRGVYSRDKAIVARRLPFAESEAFYKEREARRA